MIGSVLVIQYLLLVGNQTILGAPEEQTSFLYTC